MAIGLQDIVQIVSGLSIIPAALAVYYASVSTVETAKTNRAQLFLELRSNFQRTHAGLGFAVQGSRNVRRFSSITAEQRSAIYDYWLNCFNEYYVTHYVLGRDGTKMWRHFYFEAQAASLRYPLVRQGLRAMVDAPFAFGSLGPSFARELGAMTTRLLEDNHDEPGASCARQELLDLRNMLNSYGEGGSRQVA